MHASLKVTDNIYIIMHISNNFTFHFYLPKQFSVKNWWKEAHCHSQIQTLDKTKHMKSQPWKRRKKRAPQSRSNHSDRQFNFFPNFRWFYLSTNKTKQLVMANNSPNVREIKRERYLCTRKMFNIKICLNSWIVHTRESEHK